MTNNWKDCDKLPVVGRKYRLQKRYLDNNNDKTTRENKKVIVTEIEERKGDYLIHYKDDDGITNGLSSISFLGLYYEEDSEDNLQQKKEVSEVNKALEELKKNIKPTNYNWLTSIDYENLKQAAQNLVNVLETEKSAMNLVKHTLEDSIKKMKDFNARIDEKYPMSKPEPKIDIKEERVKPVSLWMSKVYLKVSNCRILLELILGCCKIISFTSLAILPDKAKISSKSNSKV